MTLASLAVNIFHSLRHTQWSVDLQFPVADSVRVEWQPNWMHPFPGLVAFLRRLSVFEDRLNVFDDSLNVF